MYLKNKLKSDIKTDRYFITYADIITLLLGLFVILFASSKVDEEKYKELSQAITEYFNDGNGVLQGGKGVLQGSTSPEQSPINFISKKSLNDIFKETSQIFKELISNGDLDIKIIEGTIILTLPEQLLFESGKANIQNKGIKIIDTLAYVLRGIPYQVYVDGHTDSKPIRTFQYESNWHLSVARALNVGYELLQKGLPPNTLIIRGFADQRPITENNTEQGRAKNRRVEIQISNLSTQTPSTEGYDKNENNK